MTRSYVFSDEAGCFNFSRGPNISRYFVVCTIALDSCDIGADLLDLRRQMVWEGMPVGNMFHATNDKQVIRDRVFSFINDYDFRIDATLLEKSKAAPQTRSTNERFYQYAWYYHFKHIAPHILRGKREILITAASIGTNKGQAVFTSAVNNVVQQNLRREQWATTFPPSATDPCLQIADYCTWAIQRKWEMNDHRSHDIIADKIHTEFDLWRTGTRHYY